MSIHCSDSPLWTIIGIIGLMHLTAARTCEDSDQRNEIMWYFDKVERTCFAYPVDCETPLQVRAQFYSTEEECTLEEMPFQWRRFTLSCPSTLQLAVYYRSNDDPVPYIFSPWLCRRFNGMMRSDICTSSEYCYKHESFAYCCNKRAFVGDAPVAGIFTQSGIGGAEAHIVNASIFSPPPAIPNDCNTDGDRRGIEWYPHTGMACLARRSDCKHPAFPVEEANQTYDTQQECMNAHFPYWKMSYQLTCMNGFTPISLGNTPLVFSKTLCGSAHHSDVCNRDEYCAYSNRTPVGFCCRLSGNASTISYTVYGNKFRRQRAYRKIKIFVV
ncbi:hypothetical protein RB195_012533 [Necator americanus]